MAREGESRSECECGRKISERKTAFDLEIKCINAAVYAALYSVRLDNSVPPTNIHRHKMYAFDFTTIEKQKKKKTAAANRFSFDF